MKVWLRELSEDEFYKLKSPILFDHEMSDRCFGILTNGEIAFRCGWKSNIVKPIITEIKTGFFSIGIDLDFAVIDFFDKSVRFQLKLSYFFFDTKIFNEYFFIISELEVIKVDKKALSVMEQYALPEIFEDMTFKNGKIQIKCIDNTILEIATPSSP